MSNQDKKRSGCLQDSDLAALLYNEMSESESFELEEHLAGCSSCIDEFAAVSEARLSAYEWNRDEFAHLATPVIVVPHEGVSARAGFFDKVFSGFAVFTQFGTTAAVGLAAVTIFGGYFLLRSGQETNIAETRTSIAGTPPASQPSIEIPAPVDKIIESPDDRPFRKTRAVAIHASVKKVNQIVRRPATATMENKKQSKIKPESLVAQQQSAPRLTNSAEVSDSSLRLADLLSELDVND